MKRISCTRPTVRPRAGHRSAVVRGALMKGILGFLTTRAGDQAANISQTTGPSAVAVEFPDNHIVE
jgi:hypothetical protein